MATATVDGVAIERLPDVALADLTPEQRADLDGAELALYLPPDLPLVDECGCVLPEQHCPACEAAARAMYEDEEVPWTF